MDRVFCPGTRTESFSYSMYVYTKKSRASISTSNVTNAAYDVISTHTHSRVTTDFIAYVSLSVSLGCRCPDDAVPGGPAAAPHAVWHAL